MDRIDAVKILTFLAVVHVTNGQTVSVSGPSMARKGTNVPLTCTVNGGTSDLIQWTDTTDGGSGTIYIGSRRFSQDSKYLNFNVTSLSTTESVMTIENADVMDDGSYLCTIPSDTTGQTASLEIEAPATLIVTLDDIVINSMDMYQATCDAVGSKPQVTITWKLSGVTQSDGNGNTIMETYPTATPPLSNTKSVFTFPATVENQGQTLLCETTGHQITELDGQQPRDLDIHSSPSNADTTVTVDYVQVTQEAGITVSCTAESEPRPTMRNYYIYSNGSLIHESTDGGREITVQNPVAGTNYTCLAGNYLGNTSLSEPRTYDPSRTTIPPPTTAPITSPRPNDGNGTAGFSGPQALGAGAIVGIVIGVVAVIVLIVVIIYFVLCRGKDRTDGGKHGSSTVGTSNGGEKDKIKPVAAPRDQGSIQHTTDNPGQQEYAMVDRKKPPGGGDMPDTRGPGQESPGMHYADLDLSTNAGHTERQVPQNPDNVVVYSSILV